MSEKCPKCGAVGRRDTYRVYEGHLARWLCGAEEHVNGSIMQSCECYERQLAARDAELAAIIDVVAGKEPSHVREHLTQDTSRIAAFLQEQERLYAESLAEARAEIEKLQKAFFDFSANGPSQDPSYPQEDATTPPEREERAERPPSLLARPMGHTRFIWLWRRPGYTRWHYTDCGWLSSDIEQIDEAASDPAAVAMWKREREQP